MIEFCLLKGLPDISSIGSFNTTQKREFITMIGISKPWNVVVGEKQAHFEYMEGQQKLVIGNLNVNMNSTSSIS
jgi:hypothetical protein